MIIRRLLLFRSEEKCVAFVIICIPTSMFGAIYNREAFEAMHNKMIYGAL